MIEKSPLPNFVKGIQSFLGHAKFYRRLIKGLFQIAYLLCKLCEKEVKFVFDAACLKAFEILK